MSALRRWDRSDARRHRGAVQELVRDEEVAARIATDLLRRPEVAARAMTDTTARHLVNRAQIDHARQGAEIVRQRTPAIEHVQGGRPEYGGRLPYQLSPRYLKWRSPCSGHSECDLQRFTALNLCR